MVSPITRFEIDGLFGDRKVSLDFPDDVAIVVDPNGSGKTTFMRAMVCILRRRWHQLAEINFDSVTLYFNNNKKLKVERIKLLEMLDALPLASRLTTSFTMQEIEDLIEAARFSHPTSEHPHIRRAAKELQLPYRKVRDMVRHGAHRQKKLFDEDAEVAFAEYEAILSTSFPLEVVYFPTYRRVERALAESDERGASDDMSIHFGMSDVRARTRKITQEIKESFVESYAKTSGQMLSQLIEGIDVTDADVQGLAKSEYIGIVLERLGENISKADKDNLLELIHSNRIEKPQYKPLVYFVNNLTSVYREQREKDDSIKQFAKVVNGYFSDKEIIYNESKVTVGIRNVRTGQDVEWQHLSSGEKQIASIFSRLYLTNDTKCAILFDEPELSLSIEWQRKLLADIYDSESCRFLFAATHSPFIYENTLDRFATSLTSKFVGEGDE